jgi:hypothetical protein
MELFHPPHPADLVTFDVRGRIFRTTLTTLRRFPDSVLYKMVQYEQQRNRATPPESLNQKAFFIDRDPDLFAAILRYHDTEEYQTPPAHITPASLKLEAQYYNLQSLENEILVAKSTSDKYEFLCLTQAGQQNYSIPLSPEIARAAVPNLAGLTASPLNVIIAVAAELEERNNNHPPDQYRWTLWAITGVGGYNQPINVILKGERE